MKKLHFAVVSLLVLQFFGSCTGNAQTEDQTTPSQTTSLVAKNIDLTSFASAIDNLDNEQILDVRTPKEWATGIIKDAIMANWFDADFDTQIKKLDKDKPVMIYCASGGRSAKAMQKLNSMGFKEVYNLLGGMNAWKGNGNAIVTK